MTASDTKLYPLLALRLKPNQTRKAQIVALNVVTLAAVTYRWVLLQGGTVLGGSLSFVDVAADSAFQASTGSTNALSLDGSGLVLGNGYALQIASMPAVPEQVDMTKGDLVLVVQNLTAGTNTYFGSLSWQE